MQQSVTPRSITTYVHYTGPTSATTRTTTTTTPPQQPTTVAPQDVTFKAIIHSPKPRPAPQPHHHVPAIITKPPLTTNPSAVSTITPPVPVSVSASAPTPSTPTGSVVALGDWTKDLVHLAKTAELKKHALTLQLHTANILSSHALLEQKSKAIQDVKEQRNKLDSERNRLLESLRQVNEDRDKADILSSSIEKECSDLRTKISQLSEGDYAASKRYVDRLRKELGQSPLPNLQSMLDEKSSQYLNERRLNPPSIEANMNNKRPAPTTPPSTSTSTPPQSATFAVIGMDGPPTKRPRGRPKGSKNRKSSG